MSPQSDRLPDLDTLGAAWRAMPLDRPVVPSLEALRTLVHRRTLELQASLIGEIAITIAAVAVVYALLVDGPTGEARTLAALVAVLSTVVWGFGLWNRRGTWRPLGESTAEYVQLTRRRIRAGRRSVVFVRLVMACSSVAYLAALLRRAGAGTLREVPPGPGIFLAIHVAVTLAWSVWYAARLERDQREVEGIASALALEESP